MTDQIEGQRRIEGHGGIHALTVARAHGVEAMFTLSGAHVFPMYDAAVNADPPTRLLDVRHEQTAAFAAEATGKLTRTPGLAVLTAGPGVTNGVSALAQASFSGAPMVVIGGRSPDNRWGQGALQEFDHVALVENVTRYAVTAHSAGEIAQCTEDVFTAASSPHRGPAFLDVPLDHFFDSAAVDAPTRKPNGGAEPDPDDLTRIVDQLAGATHPLLILGSDVWADGAEVAARRIVEDLGIPTLTNGMGRGVLPGGHPLLVTKVRSAALNNADLVIV
ncbi:MAG TPA: thiamine pyrophosphate-binding protein, partial [Phycicoccus sp.]|nr:thiamine pyrophosphate-binding protein [Phycicoccus sp.]